MTDVYAIHKAALAPFFDPEPREALTRAVDSARELCGENAFVAFLQEQGLAPLWHDALAVQMPGKLLSQPSEERLASTRREAAVHYALQRLALPELRSALDEEHVRHVVYKGVANRGHLYGNPALRPAADIDLLVAPVDRDRGIRCLVRRGMKLKPEAANVSHEVNLQRGALTVDLHWEILRPGRERRSSVTTLLEGRIDRGSHWALRDSGALYVALVHPVFAKYATAPQSTLVRCLDLTRLLHSVEDLGEVRELLESSGLRTAAWIMLRWLQILDVGGEAVESSLLEDTLRDVAPGKPKRWYLEQWLQRDLASRWADRAALIKIGLTGAAHDSVMDAISALRSIRRHRASNALVLEQLRQAANLPKEAASS